MLMYSMVLKLLTMCCNQALDKLNLECKMIETLQFSAMPVSDMGKKEQVEVVQDPVLEHLCDNLSLS